MARSLEKIMLLKLLSQMCCPFEWIVIAATITTWPQIGHEERSQSWMIFEIELCAGNLHRKSYQMQTTEATIHTPIITHNEVITIFGDYIRFLKLHFPGIRSEITENKMIISHYAFHRFGINWREMFSLRKKMSVPFLLASCYPWNATPKFPW